MIRLPLARQAWNSPGFEAVLKREFEQLDAGLLPLQQGLMTSSYALDDNFSTMIIGMKEIPGFIDVTVGIFFSGVIAGCNCADDPSPVEAQSEYCELRLLIDKATAEATVTLSG
jgi:hypothetical protein